MMTLSTLTQTLWISPMSSGSSWRPTYLLRQFAQMAGVGRARMTAPSSTASSGSYALARPGRICPSATLHQPLAIAVSRNGTREISGREFSPSWPGISTLPNLQSTRPSLRQKRGSQSRQNQKGQGNENYGGYRPKWLSWGCRNCLGESARNKTREYSSAGSFYQGTAGKTDWRQSIRFRPAGHPAAQDRHRYDRAAQRQSGETSYSRRPETASLPEALEGRKAVRLAAKLSPADRPLRVPRLQFSRICAVGVHGDFTPQVFLR